MVIYNFILFSWHNFEICRNIFFALNTYFSSLCGGSIDKEPFILINPGASYGSSKCWSAEGFARTVDLLNEVSGCSIVLVCGPGETKLADDIEDLAKKSLVNLSKESVPLDLLKALIKKCNLLVTVDSGPRHFAVAFKRPVVVLMGPTDPRYTETEYET